MLKPVSMLVELIIQLTFFQEVCGLKRGQLKPPKVRSHMFFFLTPFR